MPSIKIENINHGSFSGTFGCYRQQQRMLRRTLGLTRFETRWSKKIAGTMKNEVLMGSGRIYFVGVGIGPMKGKTTSIQRFGLAVYPVVSHYLLFQFLPFV